MVGPTAQIAALTCHLNARKRGMTTHRFFPDNSTCRFCEFIHFLRPKRGWLSRGGRWQVIARTPDEWMDSVTSGDFSRAMLVHESVDHPQFPDRMSAGFVGGGGRWLLSTQRGNRSEYWEAGWQVANKDAADQRIWQVRYMLVAERESVPSVATPVVELTARLIRALTEINSFAREHDLGGFADCFTKAEECLVAEHPFTLVYHRDLTPEGAISLPAARVLAACQAAWVFGGMGSWNDLGFDGTDQERYNKLSDHLYGLLNKCICAGVNESAASVQ